MFTIPQGPAGDAGEIDETLTQEGKAADAKAVGDALKDKMNFPVNEDGEISFGEKGEIPMSNGDGTISWINLDEAINDWVERAIERGVDMKATLSTIGLISSLDIKDK